jgi:hypothetical protein
MRPSLTHGLLIFIAALLGTPALHAAAPSTAGVTEKIHLSADGRHFVTASGKPFVPWGFNYVGAFGQIIEETWDTDWSGLEKDFAQMKKLGANVVRVHLQFGTYMKGPSEVDAAQIVRLRKMLDLARDNGLYLDLTGLGCYHLKSIPAWYDELSESDRWQAQSAFWEAIAKASAGHPAAFCYDLMNEPVVGGPQSKPGESKWLTGELGGMYFVQRIATDAAKRTNVEITEAWVEKLTTAIRKQDSKTLITVGCIPWAQIWPGAKDPFYSPKAAKSLDFVSIHVYPKTGELDKAFNAIGTYELGKPIVIEETFPLSCSMEEFKKFVDEAKRPDGWVSHYFGHTIQEHRDGAQPGGKLAAEFLDYWQQKGREEVGTK